MGTIFYGLCHDCKRYIDLDKFYSFAAYRQGGYADIDKEKLSDFDGYFVYRALRLQIFLYHHTDHRIGVHTEHDLERFGWYVDDPDSEQKWVEDFPWPKPGDKSNDTVDLTDPKFGTVTLKTRYGEVRIFHTEQGITCRRWLDGECVETVLIKREAWCAPPNSASA